MKLINIGVFAIALAACAGPMRVKGAPVYGQVHDLSVADIEAAITALRAELPEIRSQQLWQIVVVDSNEVHLSYREPGTRTGTRHIVERIRGRWHYTWEVVI